MTGIRKPSRRSLARVRRRHRIDDALMRGDVEMLVWAARDYWMARMKKLSGEDRRKAALALVALADRVSGDDLADD